MEFFVLFIVFSVARQLRHATAMELYKKLLTTNVKFFHITDPKDLSAFLYDLGSNFYCIEKLMDVGQKQEFVLKKVCMFVCCSNSNYALVKLLLNY